MLYSNWKNIFPPHILYRGEEYYDDGRVLSCRWYGNTLFADVEGTEIYTVSVIFDAAKKRIEDHSCNCPYGKDGTPCKHLAAVFYSLEDADTDTETDESWSAEDLVEMLSEAQMRTLLIQFAKDDPYIWEKLQLIATGSPRKKDWALDLRRITNNAVNRHGYIAYEDAYDYCCELVEYLENRVPDLIEAELFDDAFALIWAVFQEAMKQNMDDSDGGLSMIAGCCTDFWSEILEASDLGTHRKMLQWFQDHCYDFEIGEMFLEDYIFDAPWDAALSGEILLLIDEWLEQAEDTYSFESLVTERLRWMKANGAEESEITQYIKKYDYLPEIRKMQVSDALHKHDYETALSLLAESKSKNLDKPVLTANYSKQMIHIYETTNDTSRLKEELEYYIFNCSQNDLLYVGKMKTLLSQAEWEDMRSHLLNSSSMYWQRFPLLEQEGLYEEMMVRMEAMSEMHTFERYEPLLREKFPQRCINIYVRHLQKAMNRANDRNAYRSLMQTLKKLLKYPDGKSTAQQIADTWKQKYPRRTALLDEIRKAGF